MKYIDVEKLKTEIERFSATEYGDNTFGDDVANGALDYVLEEIIPSLQQEQPDNMIQWTGNNLKEVIDFTGKSPRFGEWFKSWGEFESYVHSHGDILKLFSEDGSHFEVQAGAWIAKTPDGYNVPSVARFIHAKQEQPEVDLEKEIKFFLTNAIKMNKGQWRGEYHIGEIGIRAIAHRFYELGKARKEK